MDGTWTRLWLFVMRLLASGKSFHHVFGNQCGESFYEGHNLAFAYFGGVPETIRYDNLKPAVIKVLLGRDRLENPKFIALRSHCGFESFFCLPGIDGAHEKGGVEVRSAGSAGVISSPSRTWRHSTNSTIMSLPPMS